ncbi:MAG: hypothetical protein Cons2KO_01920 [Congregibacter sp.]
MGYLTVTSGYLVAAYLVGRQLTDIQNRTILLLFLFTSVMFTFAAFGSFGRGVALANKLEAISPDHTILLDAWVPLVTASLLLCGIAASLKFMWDIRHSKIE